MPECVLERVWEYAPFEEFHLPISGQAIVMELQRNKVCGADIHKKFLVATILSRDSTKITQRFGMTLDDLLKFKCWVRPNCDEHVSRLKNTTKRRSLNERYVFSSPD